MSKDITLILKEATKDLLTPETLNEIKSAFDASVETCLNEKVKIHVEKALDEQDADYSKKLEQLLEAVDKDHAKKLTRVVEAIDANHFNKLDKIVKLYENAINKDAANYKKTLVADLDKYLDLYLDEKIPTATIKEAVENTRSEKVLNDIRNMLGVDMAMANESIREAVMDGKNTINDYKNAIKELQSKTQKLEESFKNTNAELVLEKSLFSLPREKQDYMRKMLTGKEPQYITENFQYVLDLFNKSEEQRLEMLTEQATKQTVAIGVDRPTTVVEESKKPTISSDLQTPFFPDYLSELKKVGKQ